MRSKLFQVAFLTVVLALMVPSVLLAADTTVAGGRESGSDAKKYVGVWDGSYTTQNDETNKLSLSLKKDEKGLWSGAAKWLSSGGEQAADFKSLQIADGKLKAIIDRQDSPFEITIEGQFQGDRLEGTYAISPKGSTEVAEKGTLKVAKSVAPKTGQ
ncbi:MAG TPA: hypothetical protein VFY40_17180 [Blastocatellia bacterium]|nr:hypothetical protein [Blastocatellia bacterium]